MKKVLNTHVLILLLSSSLSLSMNDLNNNLEYQLGIAIQKKNYKIIQYLLPYVDISKPIGQYKATPLHLASQEGYLEGINILLTYKAPIDAQDKDGCTPLMYALNSNKIEATKILLDNGAKPNTQNNQGVTGLMLASESEDHTLVALLLQHKALPQIQAKDKQKITALHQASQSNNFMAIQLLIQAKADPCVQRSDGITPAILTSNEKIREFLNTVHSEEPQGPEI